MDSGLVSCELCGGDGVLEMAELQSMSGIILAKDYISYCHGCPRGLEWQEILEAVDGVLPYDCE